MHCPKVILSRWQILLVLHDRPQQWVRWRASAVKWILASLSIPARRWIYSVKPSYQAFYCCVAKSSAVAHQEWVSGQDLKRGVAGLYRT